MPCLHFEKKRKSARRNFVERLCGIDQNLFCFLQNWCSAVQNFFLHGNDVMHISTKCRMYVPVYYVLFMLHVQRAKLNGKCFWIEFWEVSESGKIQILKLFSDSEKKFRIWICFAKWNLEDGSFGHEFNLNFGLPKWNFG